MNNQLFNDLSTSVNLREVVAEVYYWMVAGWTNCEVLRSKGKGGTSERGPYVPIVGNVGDDVFVRANFGSLSHSLRDGEIGYSCDIFRMRDAFDAVTTKDEFLAFIAVCGPFIRRPDGHRPEDDPGGISWTGFREWQDRFRRWRLLPVTDLGTSNLRWAEGIDVDLRGQFRVSRSDGAERLVFALRCDSVVEAVSTAIRLDVLNGVRWFSCGNCQKLVQAGSQPLQEYCSMRCRETDRQRRRRQRVREASEVQQKAVEVA